MKPILFNTEMVQNVSVGRKTVTRRPLKVTVKGVGSDMVRGAEIMRCLEQAGKIPYHVGDILYVRETWHFMLCGHCYPEMCLEGSTRYEENGVSKEGCFLYKADYPAPEIVKWRPSIHMPKEAARIFVRVTDVRVERLKEISDEQAEREGVGGADAFVRAWDGIYKNSGMNPWVWVIEFERLKEEST